MKHPVKQQLLDLAQSFDFEGCGEYLAIYRGHFGALAEHVDSLTKAGYDVVHEFQPGVRGHSRLKVRKDGIEQELCRMYFSADWPSLPYCSPQLDRQTLLRIKSVLEGGFPFNQGSKVV